MAPLTLERPDSSTGRLGESRGVHISTRDSARATKTVSSRELAPELRDDGSAGMRATESVDLLDALRQSVRHAALRQPTTLDEAVVAIRELATGGSHTEAIRAARLLRRAAIEQKHSAPRIASLALLLSDALTFTDLATVGGVAESLGAAMNALTMPFVSTDVERDVFRALVAHRWSVTPGFDSTVFDGTTHSAV